MSTPQLHVLYFIEKGLLCRPTLDSVRRFGPSDRGRGWHMGGPVGRRVDRVGVTVCDGSYTLCQVLVSDWN